MLIKGIPACPGIVSGDVYVLSEPEIVINQKPVSSDKLEEEIELFYKGRKLAQAQIENIRAITAKNIGEEEAASFDGQLEILLDEGMEE